MTSIQIDLNESQNKKVGFTKVEKEFSSKQEAIKHMIDEFQLNK